MDFIRRKDFEDILEAHRQRFLVRIISIVIGSILLVADFIVVVLSFIPFFQLIERNTAISLVSVLSFLGSFFFVFAFLTGFEKEYWLFKKEKRRVQYALSLFSKEPKTTFRKLKRLEWNKDYSSLKNEYLFYLSLLENDTRKYMSSDDIPLIRGESRYTGDALELMLLNIVGIFLSVISLGFLFPSYFIKECKYKTEHTYLDGKKLYFSGDKKEFQKLWNKWMLMTVLTVFFFALTIPLRLKRYQLRHTHIEGETKELGGYHESEFVERFCFTVLPFIFTICSLTLLKPLTDIWKYRFYCQRSSIDGRVLIYEGKDTSLYFKRLLWNFLSLITLGFFGFFIENKETKYMVSYTHLSSERERIPAIKDYFEK